MGVHGQCPSSSPPSPDSRRHTALRCTHRTGGRALAPPHPLLPPAPPVCYHQKVYGRLRIAGSAAARPNTGSSRAATAGLQRRALHYHKKEIDGFNRMQRIVIVTVVMDIICLGYMSRQMFFATDAGLASNERKCWRRFFSSFFILPLELRYCLCELALVTSQRVSGTQVWGQDSPFPLSSLSSSYVSPSSSSSSSPIL